MNILERIHAKTKEWDAVNLYAADTILLGLQERKELIMYIKSRPFKRLKKGKNQPTKTLGLNVLMVGKLEYLELAYIGKGTTA